MLTYKKIYNIKTINKSGIYKIINFIDNKFYIGSAEILNERNAQHFNLLRKNKHYNRYLNFAYQKYGHENFEFEIIEIVDNLALLIPAEQKYLDVLYDNQKNCYNMCPTAGNSFGRVCSEETKEKIRQSLKNNDWVSGPNHPLYGRKLPKSHKKKISEKIKGENHPLYGKHHSKTSRNKMSKSKKELWKTQSHPWIGRKHNQQSLKKMSLAKKGKPLRDSHLKTLREQRATPEYRKMLSEASLGKKLSDTHKENLKRIAKRGYDNPKSKAVLQYSLKKEFIKEYGSITDAAKEVVKNNNKTFTTVRIGIGDCCLGYQKSSYGFIWEYKQQ